MSKTAACFAFGKSFLAAVIPLRFAGLWRGASEASSLIALITFASILIGF